MVGFHMDQPELTENKAMILTIDFWDNRRHPKLAPIEDNRDMISVNPCYHLT